ncbi:MAG: hypothetical protein M3004_12440 [Bacteroidota bacterium]|nr:hypothetical protein [Bacteroidota bacterium]
MDNVKHKMYNYEVTPPQGVWESIAAELDTNKATVIPLQKNRSKIFYYSLAAASVAVLLFCLIFFTNRSKTDTNGQFIFSSSTLKNENNPVNKNETGPDKKEEIIMTVPTEGKIDTESKADDELIAKNIPQKDKGGPLENKNITDKKIDSSTQTTTDNNSGYITIAGPQGQSVKISAKMASLIDSSSSENSALKPAWNKKVNEWKEIMKANTLAPTPGNFLDIFELTKTLKDKK